MKVVLSKAAEEDLEEIGDTIAKNNPRRARTFVCELRDPALHLSEISNGFPLVPDTSIMASAARCPAMT